MVDNKTNHFEIFVNDILDNSGKIAMKYFRDLKNLSIKRDLSPVTKADKAIEKYIRTPANNKDGLYIYNFYLNEHDYSQPAGAMNMRKFTDVAFEYTTIDPFREVVGGVDDNYPVFNSFDVRRNMN